jgi:ABC-type protease/lipase transport system fused ATPase/permease subunit
MAGCRSYGRVLNSRSIETLVSLSVALTLALLAMAADAARGRLLARAGGRLSRRLVAPAAATRWPMARAGSGRHSKMSR